MSQSFWESEPVEDQQMELQEPELQSTASDIVFPESEDFEPESEIEMGSEPDPEPEPHLEPVSDSDSEPVPEPVSEPVPENGAQIEPVREPETESAIEAQESQILELSVDEFTALEERVLRAVNLVKRERLGRTAAELATAQLESQLAEQRPLVDQLQTEVHTLRAERDQVRMRVERLLAQLDALEI